MAEPTRAQIARLHAAWERDRALFARVYPRLARAELRVVGRACTLPGKCAFRDLAYAEPEGDTVVVLARLADLPAANIAGLLRHELGHLADTVPYRLNAGREQAADDIAEAVTGERIYYDKRAVQTLSRGEWPRPLWLHR